MSAAEIARALNGRHEGYKGKRIFDPTVDFKDRATREKFLDLVLEALRHVRPELFQHGAGEAG